MSRHDLVRKVTSADIKSEYLLAVDAKTLPEQPRAAVEEWIEHQVQELEKHMLPGDQLWFYRYEKCCGWYREGYVAVRGSCILGEINTREDM